MNVYQFFLTAVSGGWDISKLQDSVKMRGAK
jgi:hypothetical protein